MGMIPVLLLVALISITAFGLYRHIRTYLLYRLSHKALVRIIYKDVLDEDAKPERGTGGYL